MDPKGESGRRMAARPEAHGGESRPHRRARRRAPGFLAGWNARQLRVLVGVAVLLVAVLLVPPWLHEYRSEAGERWLIFAGFRPAFLPPSTNASFNLHATRVDYVMLSVEVAGLVALAIGGMRSMSDRR